MNWCHARPALALATVVSALFLVACGGGGGGDDPPAAPSPAVLSGTAAIGAALVGGEVSVTDRSGAAACDAAASTLTTGSAGEYTCVLRADAAAPFVIVVVDPRGLISPMVSLAMAKPALGETGTANISRLTTAIAAQLAPNKDPLVFATDATALAAVDAQSLSAVVAKVVAQLAPMLAEVSLTTATFDPFTTPFVGGSNSGADKLLDQLVITFENGSPVMANVLSPDTAPVPLAEAGSSSPAPVGASVTTGFSVTELDFMKSGFEACFAASVTEREDGDACNGIVVDDAQPALTGGASFLHSGLDAETYFGGLVRSEDMTGASFNRPELLRYVPKTDGRDEAVVNLKFADRNGVPDNRVLVLKKFPGTATTARATTWWVYGNQRTMNFHVQATIRQQEQMLPASAQAAFGAGPSRYQTGLNIFIAKPCANLVATCPNTSGLRYVRVKGPGLPTAGLVYADVKLPQNWMAILNATGTIPSGDQVFATSSNNIFYLQRSMGISGSEAFALRSNPFVAAATPNFNFWAHPAMYGETPAASWSFDLSRAPGWSEYVFEFFFNAETTPSVTQRTRMVTPVVPAAHGATRQWHTIPAATKALASDGAPAASSLELAWTLNPYADRIETVQVYTFSSAGAVNSPSTVVAKGASSVTVKPSAGTFAPLSVDTTGVGRHLQFRYNILDGSYQDQTVTFN